LAQSDQATQGHTWKFQNAFRFVVHKSVPRTSRTQRFVFSKSTLHQKSSFPRPRDFKTPRLPVPHQNFPQAGPYKRACLGTGEQYPSFLSESGVDSFSFSPASSCSTRDSVTWRPCCVNEGLLPLHPEPWPPVRTSNFKKDLR